MANTLYTPEQMAAAILAIPNGGYQILVTAPTGATVTASKDGKTYTGVIDTRAYSDTSEGGLSLFAIAVPEIGSYLIKVVEDGVTCLQYGQSYGEIIYSPRWSLPDGYTPLEYLESTGTQYATIPGSGGYDTGVAIEAELASTDLSVSSCTGARAYFSASSRFVCSIGVANYGDDGVYAISEVMNNTNTSQPLYDNYGYGASIKNPGTGFHTYYAANGKQWVDGAVGSQVSSGIQSNDALKLFGENGNSAISSMAKMKMRYFNYYHGGSGPFKLYIPVRRNSDSVLGMFDLVSQTLLANAGTGEFIAGPEVTL